MITSSLLSTIILIALFNPSSCDYRKQLVAYTVNFIQHLQSQHRGFFQIWFYHAAPTAIPSDPILQEIQSALNLIPQLSLNAFDSRWVLHQRQPIPLVIIQFESVLLEQARWQNFTQLLIALDSHSKVLILTSFESPDISLEVLVVPFLHSRAFNVVYLSLDRELYVFYDYLRSNLTILTEFPTFKKLFPNPTRDFNGLKIRFTVPKVQMLNFCPSGIDCSGYDITVVHVTAKYLNASVQHVTLICEDESSCSLKSIAKMALDITNCPFDIYADQVFLRSNYENYFVQSPISCNDVFLVPRGRSLNVVELFLMPFRFEVWTLLLSGLLLVKFTSYFIAGGFQNDVLLLPICGFERFDLNRAGRVEKAVIFSLIVFFFFLSNAYESKFTSLMTRRPPAFEIDTFEDIIHLQLTVKASKERIGLLPGYDFNFLFIEDVNVEDETLDGTSVYLTNEKRAEVALHNPANWNFQSNQPRYKLITQRLGHQPSFYLLNDRSLVKPWFYHVQRILFEGGLLQLWFQQMVNLFYSGGVTYLRTIPEEGLAPTASILKFSDLLPLWNVLALGFCISWVVFGLEVGIGLCSKYLSVELRID